MTDDTIREIRIDESGRLFVFPSTAKFPYVYRTGMEVHWDEELRALYSPKPREWSYQDWFTQIIRAAREQGTRLAVSQGTVWVGIAEELKHLITNESRRN